MWLSACGNSTSSVGLSTRLGSAVTGSALTRTSSQRLELSNGITVDVGTYDEIEFDIGKVDPATAPTALKELAEQGASLIIDGHIDGEPFQFVSSLRVEQEREVSFEIAEGDDQNVTFNIDPSGWFTDKDGKRLDPRESSARSQLENNLQKSIDAFDDHDRNGGEDDDDHDRHGGRSGGEN
ncbi:hypothetical protein [Corallococcus sp. AB038B]|uniref:hypothetical protein n=1 Tax=Corallococcus sp. AB038B TaxID=2316718 RepID=UPI000ED6121D|nr:hypothetical protein [Corallococcus sp. AB038B]RKI05601.1 hypothetical protein D7Y04_10830 [Corallococcus sp. AB038B]